MPAVLLVTALLVVVAVVILRRGERRVLSRVVGVLTVASLVAAAVTAVSVARRSFGACQAANPLDAVVQVSRGYDPRRDEVLCRYVARDGRVAESRVRAWLVLTQYTAN